jgi:hypothetical protein
MSVLRFIHGIYLTPCYCGVSSQSIFFLLDKMHPTTFKKGKRKKEMSKRKRPSPERHYETPKEEKEGDLHSFSFICDPDHKRYPVLILVGEAREGRGKEGPKVSVEGVRSLILNANDWENWRDKYNWKSFLNQGNFLSKLADHFNLTSGIALSRPWIADFDYYDEKSPGNKFSSLPPVSLYPFLSWYGERDDTLSWLTEQIKENYDKTGKSKPSSLKPSILAWIPLCAFEPLDNPGFVLGAKDVGWIGNIDSLRSYDVPPFTLDKPFVNYYQQLQKSLHIYPSLKPVADFLEDLLLYKTYQPSRPQIKMGLTRRTKELEEERKLTEEFQEQQRPRSKRQEAARKLYDLLVSQSPRGKQLSRSRSRSRSGSRSPSRETERRTPSERIRSESPETREPRQSKRPKEDIKTQSETIPYTPVATPAGPFIPTRVPTQQQVQIPPGKLSNLSPNLPLGLQQLFESWNQQRGPLTTQQQPATPFLPSRSSLPLGAGEPNIGGQFLRGSIPPRTPSVHPPPPPTTPPVQTQPPVRPPPSESKEGKRYTQYSRDELLRRYPVAKTGIGNFASAEDRCDFFSQLTPDEVKDWGKKNWATLDNFFARHNTAKLLCKKEILDALERAGVDKSTIDMSRLLETD